MEVQIGVAEAILQELTGRFPQLSVGQMSPGGLRKVSWYDEVKHSMYNILNDELGDLDLSLNFQTIRKRPISFKLRRELISCMYEWEHFEPKICSLSAWRKWFFCEKNLYNYPSLKKHSDQTTLHTRNHSNWKCLHIFHLVGWNLKSFHP